MEKSQAYWRCGKSGPGTGKADRKMEDRNISVPDFSVSFLQARAAWPEAGFAQYSTKAT
jgi:hypothetical protein